MCTRSRRSQSTGVREELYLEIERDRLGLTPKVITSASESSSLPNSLVVLVMRAMRPSRASNGMAKRMAMDAQFSNVAASAFGASD